MKEIERKWLVDGFPTDLELIDDWDVFQSYLHVSDEIEIRLIGFIDRTNKKEPWHKLTIKTGKGLTRIELGTQLTKKEYDEFLAEVKGTPIVKHFQRFLLDKYRYDISFVDNNFYYSEIEFSSEEEALNFQFPYSGREVTNQQEYYMKDYWVRNHQNIEGGK